MGMAAWKRAGVCLTAAAVVMGVAGCQDGDGGGTKKKAADSTGSEVQTQNEMTKVLQAAFKNTSEAKSSKVRMTVTTPAGVGGDGTMEMSGVQGWDPAVMDVTMKGSAFGPGDPGASEQSRVIMVDGVMYSDMGEEAAEMDGKRWIKMDFGALAEASGDPEAQKQMTGGLENMNQDPAQQIALLLQSENLKHVGPEKVEGVETQHYKGTLSIEEMLDANKTLDGMFTPEEREKLVANMKKTGLKGYDTEVWVNEDNYPAKMVVGMQTSQGEMKMTTHYSDYGAAVEVEAPPASETLDFMEMMKGLEELGAGA